MCLLDVVEDVLQTWFGQLNSAWTDGAGAEAAPLSAVLKRSRL